MSTQPNNIIALNPLKTFPAMLTIPYEQRLASDSEFAWTDSSLFFDGHGSVKYALREITNRLNDLSISYAIIGGLALNYWGFRRFTPDVDILVSSYNLRILHERLQNQGFQRCFTYSRAIREVRTGVLIDLHVSEQLLGNFAANDLETVRCNDRDNEFNGMNFVSLNSLMILKLTHYLTKNGATKHLGDVQELIRYRLMPASVAEELPKELQATFHELWRSAMTGKRYGLFCKSDSPDMIAKYLTAGLATDPTKRWKPEYVYFYTLDPFLAAEYNMHPEDEFLFT